MSPGGKAEAMARLRCVLATIETEANRDEGASRNSPPRRVRLTRVLDQALGGGLAGDALHEITPAAPADSAAAMGFALALAAQFLARRSSSALVIGESFAAEETGALYGPGLVGHGLSLSRLVFVRGPDAAAAFWAMEEALKSGAPAAVIGEFWSLKAYGLAVSRRLLLAARKGRTPALLVLARAYDQADRLSSAAETRFEIAAAPSARLPASGGKDLPGPFACTARLVKARPAFAREGVSQAVDPERRIRLEWRREGRTFDDPTLSFSLDAASGDRPRAAAQSR